MPGLIVLALIAGFFGVVFASQATIGVALVGIGCIFAILARIRQAQYYELGRQLPPAWALFPTMPSAPSEAQWVPWTPAQWVALAVVVAIFAGAAYVGLGLGRL